MYIIYIYDILNNVIAQIDEVLDVQISRKLNDISSASFSLYHTNKYCDRDYLKEYRRVKINVLCDDCSEDTFFDGVIRGIEADLTKVSIKCESFEHLLDRRLLHADYTYTAQTVNTILSGIIGDINTRYDTGISLDVQSLEFPTGSTEASSLTHEIVSNPDDGFERSNATGVWVSGSNTIGKDVAFSYANGLRFQGVQIPVGSTITSAVLQITSNSNTSANTNINIYGVAEDDCAVFNNSHLPSSITKTTAVANWNIGTTAWITGQNVQTVDISTVVQEIVDRSGWHLDHSMGFIFDGSVSPSNGSRSIYDFTAGSTTSPKIIINFTYPVSGPIPVTKAYNKGESALKVLKDLTGLGYEFIIDNKVLKFKPTIGIDRTEGVNFLEYRYDINEPDYRSINSIKMTTDGKELATGVIGKSGSNFTELDDAIAKAEFGLIETIFTNSGDQANETTQYLTDHKQSISEFDVDTKAKDFFEADLGDVVKVYIYVGNDVLFFDGSMKVVQKTYSGGDLEDVKFTLSKGTMTSKNIIDKISEISDKVKAIELSL